PQALTMLRSLSRRDASPYREIVDQCLLAEAVARRRAGNGLPPASQSPSAALDSPASRASSTEAAIVK
ncbi:hypothetical protein, partial [Streptosporangium sp. NPDC048865]|uniref:hypothetical protein n=1 Tax=Streptosporangium sp. NPDC048865 TaxID=3155766 RepID=UPI00342106FC